MQSLANSNYTNDILTVNLGVEYDNDEPKSFTLKVNDRVVMMTYAPSTMTFNEVIKNAIRDSFKSVHYDEKKKTFLGNESSFNQKEGSLGFLFEYQPIEDDYNQIRNDMPEAMYDMYNDQLAILESM